MLRSAREMQRYSIRAADGDAGAVERFYFDDAAWEVRYLVARAGGLLKNRQVLIAPGSIEGIDPEERVLRTSLTGEQVENAPGIEADRPVAAQREIDHHASHGAPRWGSGWEAAIPPGPPISPAPYPGLPETAQVDGPEAPPIEEHGDPHLRSTNEVIGYRIGAAGGEIGHVEDFIVDDEGWEIRYLAVDTRDWLPGKKVLVSPRWISGMSWTEREVHVDLPTDEIRGAPEWDPDAPIDRDYEARLHEHFGRSPYWDQPRG